MSKAIKFTSILVGLLLNMSAFSMSEHILQTGVPMEIVLASNDPKVFPNVFMWTVKGHCTVISDEQDNYLSFKALRKTGSVNGIQLTEGNSLSLIVHPNETISVTADPNAKVEIVNTGLNTVKAICSAD